MIHLVLVGSPGHPKLWIPRGLRPLGRRVGNQITPVMTCYGREKVPPPKGSSLSKGPFTC